MGILAAGGNWEEAERRNDELNRLREQAAADPSTPQQAQVVAQSAQDAYWMPAGYHMAVAKAGWSRDIAQKLAVTSAQLMSGVGKSAQQDPEGTIKALKGDDRGGGGFWDTVGDAAKGVARTGFSVLEAPYQEVVGQARNVAGTISQGAEDAVTGGNRRGSTLERAANTTRNVDFTQSQSDFGVAVGDVVQGETSFKDFFLGSNTSLGSGILPDKRAGAPQEAARRARETISIDGHAWTPGRFVASMVVEPGTKPYTVLSGLTDAAVNWYGDPANRALDALVDAKRAHDTFEVYGLVPGARKTTLPEVADAWLASREGQKRLAGLAGERDWVKIWRSFGRNIDVDLAKRLAESGTVDDALNVLKPELGITIRQRSAIPQLGTAIGETGATMRRWTSDRRFLGDVPRRVLNLDDHQGAMRNMDDFLRNAKVNGDARNALLDQFGTALLDPAPTVTAQALKAVENATAKSLEGFGLDPDVAADMVTSISATTRKIHRFALDEVGNNLPVKFLPSLDGAPVELADPHLLVEQLSRNVVLPDPKEIKAAASRLNFVYRSKAGGGAIAAGDAANKAWKNVTILRGAYTLRVVAEEQIRMAAHGSASMFSHPLTFLAFAVGNRESKFQRFLDAIPGIDARGASDVMGLTFEFDDLASEFSQALGRNVAAAGLEDQSAKRLLGTGNWVLTNRGDADYVKAWGEELRRVSRDEVVQKVAAGGGEDGIDGVKEWLAGRQDLLDQLDKLYAEHGADFTDRRVIDGYVDSVVDRVRAATGNDPDLMKAISDGYMPDGLKAFTPAGSADTSLRNHLKSLRDQGIGPERMKVEVKHAADSSKLDDATNTLFEWLAGKPTRTLSRSPTFRQAYWERMSELVGSMDNGSRNLALKAAEDTLKPKLSIREDVYDRLLENAKKPAGDLTLADADHYAKVHALEETKKLLYDTTKRSQWAQSLRIVSPFAEAWKEQMVVWSKLMTDPSNLRRAQQVVQGARGAGFFYKDPVTGEEMFNYPGSGALMKTLTGVNVNLRAPVQDLSLIGNVMPGVGPLVQFPLAKLIPDKPEYDFISRVLLPYGEPNLDEGFLESQILPAWMKRMRTGLLEDPGSSREFGNMVGDVMGVLAASGKYGPGDIDKLYNDAVPKARALYVLRGVATFGLPAAPSFDPKVDTPEGMDMSISMMANDFFEKMDGDVGKFIDTYGEDAFMFMVGKSRSLVGGQGASKQYGEWEKGHGDLVRKYSEVAGYFGPDMEGFDYQVYNRQFRTGQREARSPEERFNDAQALVAGFKYRAKRELLPDNPSPEQRQWLRDWKDTLKEQYPGWDPEGFVNDAPKAMRELYGAVKDPKVVDTPQGKALATYLEKRDAAMAQLAARKLTVNHDQFSQAKAAADLRSWLYQWGESLVDTYPDFNRLWDQVLAPEVDDSQEEGS